MCLSKSSPLHCDWKLVCDRALKLTQEDIDVLAHKYPIEPMKGVFDIMRERKMIVGQLVAVLSEIERLDALEILTNAGYPLDAIPSSGMQGNNKDKAITKTI